LLDGEGLHNSQFCLAALGRRSLGGSGLLHCAMASLLDYVLGSRRCWSEKPPRELSPQTKASGTSGNAGPASKGVKENSHDTLAASTFDLKTNTADGVAATFASLFSE